MRILACSLLSMLFLILQPVAGSSQSPEEFKALKEEVKALKEGQKALKKEVEGLKGQIKSKPATAPFKETVVSVENDLYKGTEDAKVAVIEFSDYQ
jgi:predicted  nucleic acid-binding Zn-ribbon protein